MPAVLSHTISICLNENIPFFMQLNLWVCALEYGQNVCTRFQILDNKNTPAEGNTSSFFSATSQNLIDLC